MSITKVINWIDEHLIFMLFGLGIITWLAFNASDLIIQHYSPNNDFWYSNSWREPITKIAFAFQKEKRIFLEPNAIGNQLWIVKEIKFGGKTYWTVLRKFDNSNPKAKEHKEIIDEH